MKVVLNGCYGGFEINERAYDAIKRNGEAVGEAYYIFDNFHVRNVESLRYSPTLISIIEDGVDCNTSCSNLYVVDIPDEATDYRINDYDGVESVIYVLDGKLHTIS